MQHAQASCRVRQLQLCKTLSPRAHGAAIPTFVLVMHLKQGNPDKCDAARARIRRWVGRAATKHRKVVYVSPPDLAVKLARAIS
jgi:hypothetical protein